MDNKCKSCKNELPQKIAHFATYCNSCYDRGQMFHSSKELS